MTEDWLRAFAAKHGLGVGKQVTTGTQTKGFARFELFGPSPTFAQAARELTAKAVEEQLHPSFHGIRRSDIDGQPYLFVESVWFES
jgi:hypothetical protein